MRLVATAGHVDHGKSTLVRALTGVDPDRWEEEQRRGMTIDLGFARMALPEGEVEFIDVPGHVRFLRNMLAGVGSVRSCLFVVAANEGWKPQSEEHLRILELVGVRNGVIALTKTGALSAEETALAREAVDQRVANTFLAGAPIVACDAIVGVGVADVAAALAALPEVGPEPGVSRPRLWVDRSFAIRGSGTVVTGTLLGGSVSVEDGLDVLPPRRHVRVRSVQSHGRSLRVAEPGRRTALNLVGASAGDIGRGDALVVAEQWEPTKMFDASLRVLDSLGHPVTRRGAYLAYIGSGEHAVKLRLLVDAELEPGQEGTARVHLPVALPLLPGDRYVLRDSGRGETVGGGEVLDVAPVLSAARARPDRDIERLIDEHGWIDADRLERITGHRREPTAGRWVASARALAEARAAVLDAASQGRPASELSAQERTLAGTLTEVAVVDGVLQRADRARAEPAAQGPHPYLQALDAAPFTPPSPAEAGCPAADTRALLRSGAIVERDGVYFSASAIAKAAELVADLLERSPDGITASAVREALGTTRKFAIPLLEHLDSTGVTRRRGDVRVGGPRLPRRGSG